MLGLMGIVSDDYLVVTLGVLYIFEHDLGVVSRVYPLNDRMKLRRLFVSNADQTSGGWHFTRDYYCPEPDEFNGENPETGDLLVDDEIEAVETFGCERKRKRDWGRALSVDWGEI
jgi:hypothetical protein